MSMVLTPVQTFFDADGTPLENGYVFIGQTGMDARTNPIQVYFDDALTITADQPIRTLAGYPAFQGAPAQLFVAETAFTVTVLDKNQVPVFTNKEMETFESAAALSGPNGSSLVGFIDSGTGAVATTLQSVARDFGINAKWYGATGNGTTDDTAAINLAWNAARDSGRYLYFPPGTYVISSTISLFTTTFVGAFGAGPRIMGSGLGKTIFDNRVANGPMFDIDSNVNHAVEFKGVLGCVLSGFTIKTTTSPVVSTAIRLKTTYMGLISQVHIDGMTGDGIRIPCVVGDNDGSNMIAIEHVRIENCDGWGIDAAGDSGRNETSFVRLRHVFIQACGTLSAAYQPPSGGMKFKGQITTLDQCAFTLNENCALWIPGEAGLCQTVDIQNTTFENNKQRGFFTRGVSALKMRNVQFYNNNSFISTVACEFEAASFTIRNVDIDGVVIRATDLNNPYTAFKISGTNADLKSCRVRNVVWENFDYTGQTRFDGWQFDEITPQAFLRAETTTSITLRPDLVLGGGNVMPLRLRGGGGGTPSTTGEWVEIQIPSTGLSATNSGLAASTRHYVYLFDDNGISTLDVSTTAFVIDAATGYPVKTGAATHFYVGSVETDAGSLFMLTAGGWLNPNRVSATQVGVFNYLWCDATGDLRVKNATLPTSDTDGTVVGTQT